uniref:Uncharacterized protein n=1 Tax=Panagrolaimus superbus TaxID=310955 RepID=A0A914Z355_9BILA
MCNILNPQITKFINLSKAELAATATKIPALTTAIPKTTLPVTPTTKSTKTLTTTTSLQPQAIMMTNTASFQQLAGARLVRQQVLSTTTAPFTACPICNTGPNPCKNNGTLIITGPDTVSHITEITLKTQKHEFRVDANTNYYIDGIITYYPNYWPSETDPRIVATKPGARVIIQDNLSGAVITFANGYLCVEVPLNEMFYGNDTMCGIWGNINDVCGDDIEDKNGNQFIQPANGCRIGTNSEAFHFMDSWVVDSTVNNCVEAEVLTNITTTAPCDIQAAQNQCDLIRQAINGQGPFAACTVMGHDAIDKTFHDCAFDICHSFQLCDTLNAFALLCNNFPFTNIDNWRDIANCPYTCPPNSHFSMKTPKCQNSCSDPNYSNSSNCQDGYEQGCTCDANYYFDSNGEHTGFAFACRALNDCGCVDGNGNYYPAHSKWLDANCTIERECNDGNLTSNPVTCSTDAQCNIVDGFSTCQCDAGYSGDGYICNDIDECQDSNMCSSHGNCTNFPATYKCTCYSPFSGLQCENYTPSRHCADLQIYHKITHSGAYNISLAANYTMQVTNADLTWTEVFCDMESNGGGWTLMSHESGSAATKKINCGKTFREYVRGFGDPISLTVWLGLENVHAITAATPTSLRIIIEQCAAEFAPYQKDECTYPYFSVSDSNSQYAIFLNNSCIGPANGRNDDWITWDRNQMGPKFYAFDEDTPYNCSNTYLQTGWWFNYVNNGDLCGAANLNGIRYACNENEYQYTGKHLSWGNSPVNDAYMYLRPRDFPNYDSTTTSPPSL